MRTIGGVFGRSPMGPLYEHMLRVMDCLTELKPLMNKFVKEDFSSLKAQSRKISKFEHKADQIKDEIKISLTKSFISATNRSDILALLKEQDAIADSCEALSHLLAIRNTRVHPTLSKPLLNLTEKVMHSVTLLCEANKEIEKSIRKENHAQRKKLLEKIKQIQKTEWETDEIQLKIHEQIFSVEREIDPITIVFLMDVVKKLGWIADHAENTGDVLRRIVT